MRTRYDRVTIQQVCAVKDQNYEPRDLAVWVRADREWSKLSPSRVQELWQANTKERSRSFCRFISRDLLKLSSQEYAGVKRSLESADSEELTGIYQARDASDDEYALVIEFPSSSALVRNLLIAGASVGGVLAAGAIAKQVRSKYASPNPDSTKSTSVDDVQKHQIEVVARQSELSALDEEIKRKKQEDGALKLSINELQDERAALGAALEKERREHGEVTRRRSDEIDQQVESHQRAARDEIQRIQKAHAADIELLEEEKQRIIGQIHAQIDAENRTLEVTRSKVDGAQRSFEEVERQLRESRAQFAALQQETHHQQQNNQEQIDQHANEVSRLEEAVRKLNAEVGSSQQQRDEVQRLREQSAQFQQGIETRRDELARLEAEHTQRAGLATAQRVELQALAAQLSARRGALQDVDANLAKQQRVQDEIDRCETQLLACEKKTSALRETVQSLQQERDVVEQRIATGRAEEQRLQTSVGSLKSQETTSRTELASSQANVESLQRERDRLEESIRQLTEHEGTLQQNARALAGDQEEIRLAIEAERAKLERISAQISNTETRLAESERRILELQADESQRAQNILESNAKVIAAEQQRGELEQSIRSQTSELARLKAEHESAKEERKRGIEEEEKQYRLKIKAKEAELDDVQRRVERQRTELQTLDQELKEFSTRKGEEIRLCSEELGKYEAKTAGLGAEVTALQAQRVELEKNILNIRTDESSARNSIEALRIQERDAIDRLTSTQQQFENLKQEQTRLEGSIQTLNTERQSAERELVVKKEETLRTINEENQKFDETRARIQSELASLQTNKKASAKQLAYLQGQLAELEPKVMLLTTQQSDVQQGIRSLTVEKDALISSVEPIQARVTELNRLEFAQNEQMNQSRRELDRVNSDLASLRTDLSECQRIKSEKIAICSKELSDCEKKTLELGDTVATLKMQQADVEERISELKASEVSLKRSVEQLTHKKNESTAELRLMQQSLVSLKSELTNVPALVRDQFAYELGEVQRYLEASRRESEKLHKEQDTLRANARKITTFVSAADSKLTKSIAEYRALAELMEKLDEEYHLKLNAAELIERMRELDAELEQKRAIRTRIRGEVQQLEDRLDASIANTSNQTSTLKSTQLCPREQELEKINRSQLAELETLRHNYELLERQCYQSESLQREFDKCREQLQRLRRDNSKLAECAKISSALDITTLDEFKDKLGVKTDDEVGSVLSDLYRRRKEEHIRDASGSLNQASEYSDVKEEESESHQEGTDLESGGFNDNDIENFLLALQLTPDELITMDTKLRGVLTKNANPGGGAPQDYEGVSSDELVKSIARFAQENGIKSIGQVMSILQLMKLTHEHLVDIAQSSLELFQIDSTRDSAVKSLETQSSQDLIHLLMEGVYENNTIIMDLITREATPEDESTGIDESA